MSKPLCPKCGEPVCKGGTSAEGIQRWMHSEIKGQRKLCFWHGTRPVGIDTAESAGVDQKATKALAARVRQANKARFVITSAQNATPVNKAFLASLLGYCKARGAQLLVIPYRYKNPTSMWSKEAENDDWWAAEITAFLIDQRVDLNPNLVLLADIKTQPTAGSPLQGFEGLTGAKSAVVGHPKLELVTVPTPQSKMAKILTTTGAVTEKNYIPAKAGKKAEHHHTFGACVVEVDGKRFHMRQINAMRDGSFCDLDAEYSGGKVQARNAEALVMGDSHVEFIDPQVADATFKGRHSIVHALRPKYLVWHDVHDFYSRNHHHRGEVFVNYVKHHTGRDNVEKWLDHTFAFIDKVTPSWCKNVFVPSNHPDALARWVKETDPRSDLENIMFWAETVKALCAGAQWTDTGATTVDPFVYWAKKKLKTAAQTVFLGRNDSFTIKDIEVGYHGDAGPNGARGTRKAFTRIGTKTVIGHSHSPGIKDGVYQVGTSSRLGLEYQRGPSSWLHTHCVIYANGKRSLINIIGGEWRA